MKKALAIILTITLLLSFGLFALGSSSEDSNASTQNNAEKTPAEVPAVADNQLGDYQVEIKSCRLASDYEGNPVVIVTYNFKNVSNKNAAAFTYSITDTVYQDGIGLNKAYFLDDSANYSSDNQSKELKMGASLDIEVAYELNNTTSDVVVEVTEWISFSDKILSKTFSIA